MQPGWMSWVAFVVLAAMVSVTSCQVWERDTGPSAEGEVSQ
ncbi:MAG: hypothetical protein AAGB15_08465 [Pseudomonadota bacterium]